MSVLSARRRPTGASLAGLLTLVARGDQAGFAELYHRTAARVLGLATALLGDAAAAQDVTAAVYQELWHTADRYDPAHGSAHAWLMAVTHRHAVRHLRASHRDPASAAAAQLASAQAASLPAALRHLDPLTRKLILLVYYGGCTTEQAASLLGLPPGTAGPRLRAALHALPPSPPLPLPPPPRPELRTDGSRPRGRHRRGASAPAQSGDTVR